jgi:hypothetical protein
MVAYVRSTERSKNPDFAAGIGGQRGQADDRRSASTMPVFDRADTAPQSQASHISESSGPSELSSAVNGFQVQKSKESTSVVQPSQATLDADAEPDSGIWQYGL